ncbi:MAG TPA: hypothetical protein V6C81_30430 [Planktothrix sp.]
MQKHGEPPPKVEEEINIPEAQAMVIKRLQIKRQSETAKWLTNLSTSNVNPAVEAAAAAAAAPGISTAQKEQEVRELLDKAFAHFEDYAYEFNQSALGTEMVVTASRPVSKYIKLSDASRLGPEANPEGRASVYEGSLSTHNWTMVFRGRYDKVEIYLLPAESHLAFQMDPAVAAMFSPFIELVGNWDSGQLVWQMYGTTVTAEQLKPVAKELFGDLIRVSSGRLDENELFAQYSGGALKLGENVAVGYDPKAPAAAAPAAQPKTTGKNPDSGLDEGDQAIFETCDLLDQAIDKEIKVLYEQARDAKGDQGRAVRAHIEALQSLKQRVEEGFHDYVEKVPRQAPALAAK